VVGSAIQLYCLTTGVWHVLGEPQGTWTVNAV